MDKKFSSSVELVRNHKNQPAKYLKGIAALSIAGLIDFIPITLYQLGLIRHLPDLPGKWFDSDYVNASDEAQIAGIPDGPISLFFYAVSILLSATSLSKRKSWSYLIGAITLGQAAGGAYYLTSMITKQKKICPYCVAGAMINFASLVPLYKLLKTKKIIE